MTRLADIERRIGSMGELRDIVTAMRSLAGMRMQEAQRSLAGVRTYAASVAAAIADTLPLLEDPGVTARHGTRGRLGLVLCAAEHGFVGGFTEHLLAAVESRLGPDDILLVVGSRGAAMAEERGWPVAWSHPMATRPAAVPEVIHRLSTEIYRRIAAGTLHRVEVVHARCRQGGAASVETLPVLPLDATALACSRPTQPPIHTLPPAALQEKLIAEYVFALLTEAAVESIAAENSARFMAMESARDNVDHKLDELAEEARHARQSEITAELLDIVTGAEAAAAGG